MQDYVAAGGSENDAIAEEGPEVWRERWLASVRAVNKSLDTHWPPAKKDIYAWMKAREQQYPYMANGIVGDVTYIGSLAKGYKSPPKQSVRFQPEKFDVDANLFAPPLATYALAKLNLPIDRGRITGGELEIASINRFEQQVQADLLKLEGYDEGEDFSLVVEARGISSVKPQNPDAEAKEGRSKADQDIRDRIWRIRSHSDHGKIMELGAKLEEIGLALLDGSSLILRNAEFGPTEIAQINSILNGIGF
jgi:hypothetical protein